MGAELQTIDSIARVRADDIPMEVRTFLSHHLRNSLMGLLCVAYVNNRDEKVQKEIETIVGHIENDIGSLGI